MTTVATTSIPASARTFPALPGDHRFFSTMSIVTAVTILAGFSNFYVPRLIGLTPAVPWIVHLHAVVFTSWLVFYVTQTTLVATGRTAIHRRIGIAGVVLAVLMLVVGSATSITMTRLGDRGIPGVMFPDPGGFLFLNLAAVGVFATLVVAGWYFRRNAQAHKRLMLMATASGLVGPGVSRLPFVTGNPPLIAVIVMAFVFAGPIYDFVSRRRVHPAYFFSVPLAFLATPPIAMLLSATSAWHRIAAVLLR